MMSDARLPLLAIFPVFLAPTDRVQCQTIVLREVTQTAGLVEPLAGLLGHGAAWGDFDGDGHLDLFVGGFADRPDAEYAPASAPVPNRLLRNRGDGSFEQVVKAGGPGGDFARTSGAVFADLDNDGFPELYVANNARAEARKDRGEIQAAATTRRSALYRNDEGVLSEVPPEAGALPPDLLSARNIGVFDYDGDGLLDLFIVEDRFIQNPRSALLRNLGGLRFEDITEKAGLPGDLFGLGLAVADLNGDGTPDFFVPHSNRLFLSQKGGRYREAVELEPVLRHQPFDNEDWPCGAMFADVTRNGLLDLVVTTHSTKGRIRLFLNGALDEKGIPKFREVTAEAGLSAIIPARVPHVEFQDFDNDGWPDLYVSAGWLEDGEFTPLIFRHTGLKDGIPRFQPNRPIGSEMAYYPAGPTADFDGDGRIDIFLCNWFQGNRSRLLRNESPRRHWLQVRVEGTATNRDGIGGEIRVTRAGQTDPLLGYQQITTGYGYASGQPAIAHFGLGDVSRVDVEVRLPDGTLIQEKNLPADRLLKLRPPE
jgi:enediyne biosynthesis protein E4